MCNKTGDLKILAEIKSRKGDHNGSVRTFLKDGHILEALAYAAEHESKISDLYKKRQVAHDQINILLKCVDLNNSDSVKLFQEVLDYLPGIERVEYLKRAHMLEKASEILEAEDMYDEVFKIYVAQGWFMKA